MSPDGNGPSGGQPEPSAAPAEAAEPFLGLGTWEWDPRSGELWWSEGIYRIIGVNPASFAPNIGKVVAMTLEEDRWVHNVDAASTALPAYSIYYRIRRPDGVVRTLRETGGASPRWTLDAPRVICTIMDVTNRVALDDEPEGAGNAVPPLVGT